MPNKTMTGAAGPRIYRIAETCQRVGYSTMHLARLEKEGKFPKRFKLSPGSGRNGAVGHLAEDVDAWIAARRASRGACSPLPLDKPVTQAGAAGLSERQLQWLAHKIVRIGKMKGNSEYLYPAWAQVMNSLRDDLAAVARGENPGHELPEDKRDG